MSSEKYQRNIVHPKNFPIQMHISIPFLSVPQLSGPHGILD